MKALNLTQILEITEGTANREADITIKEVSALIDGSINSISFLGNKRYISQIKDSQAAIILVDKEFDTQGFDKLFISCEDPSASFTKVANYFAPPTIEYQAGIDPAANIAENAQIGEDVYIGPGAIIMDGATIGNNAVICANAYVGHQAEIGAYSILYPNSTVRERCIIGQRVILHSSCVIGTDGFGFIPGKDGHKKIPQIGIVQLHDDVEVGSCTTIDRARFGKTIVGEGTKLDNIIQIGHNVIIGKHCFIVSLVAIAGSVQIGNFVTIAGQAGISGHLQIGDGCTIMGKAGVTRDLNPGEVVMGMPATSRREFIADRAQLRKISKLEKRLKALEEKLK
ncbi:UDP-3-O-[3-hydroxymyristoyl] glucosamine [Lentisphaera araneosa HTCC2155]|jgi:UDP-3-O-[3-hydroxymyristoyl] glucosamine N-acyltransferase|uniref:UDP-3-O-acylglucosamine N-acyltransferase n=1 Tax=Lentisphaera araneosa HTCC2155 TaxID=313628 RepID=A6DLF2_9BACT|nr:UDP-3-O-(3-hydroxymyristoyl)glucosamine N-acyltransferase [Lentisphaera araneosa]EDM27407.1 UDP-3-O-[3-hydroxymyristoyl] glucosamine [Lentisphaera araneosa HTCC2155]